MFRACPQAGTLEIYTHFNPINIFVKDDNRDRVSGLVRLTAPQAGSSTKRHVQPAGSRFKNPISSSENLNKRFFFS